MKPSRDFLVPQNIGSLRFNFWGALWLWSMLFGALYGLTVLSFTLIWVSVMMVGVTLCLGHSVGLHRGVIHQSYACHPTTRKVLTYLFVLSGLGGPVAWARLHAIRDYWQNRKDCPDYFAYRHSLWRDFWLNLHLRFEPTDNRADAHLPPGCIDDTWLVFLERTWLVHNGIVAVLTYSLGGGAAVAICFCGRIAASILGHWAVGYAAHTVGAQPYRVEGASEMGTNIWILGVFSFGEGFHNNHHAFPSSARMGLKWWQLDLGWWALLLMRKLGLVWNIQEGKSCSSAAVQTAPL